MPAYFPPQDQPALKSRLLALQCHSLQPCWHLTTLTLPQFCLVSGPTIRFSKNVCECDSKRCAMTIQRRNHLFDVQSEPRFIDCAHFH